MNVGTSAPKPYRLTIGHILALATFARLAVFLILPDQNFPDAKAYRDMGIDLVERGSAINDIYMPLYPLWTYLTGSTTGLKLADIGLSVATVWLVYELARVVFGRLAVALTAALAAAVYPHFLFYAVSGLSETFYLFLTCASFLLFYRNRFGLASLFMVLSILVRPTVDYLAPLLVVVFAVVIHRRSWTEGGRRLAVYGLLYVALLTPWWIHNQAKFGQFVRLTLGDGMVLYSGNNPFNRSGGGVGYGEGEVGFGRLHDDMDLTPFKDIHEPVARNQALKDAAIAYIKDHPGRFIELAGVKFLRFWRPWPYAPGYQSPWVIAVSLMSFGVVAVLCGVFVLRFARPFWRPLTPIYLFAAYLTLVHMVTIGSIRYRLPLEPFMIVMAASAAVRMAQGWEPSRRLVERWLDPA